MDVKTYFDQNPGFEIVWRVTKSLEKIIGVTNTLQELSTLELTQVLSRVDAVITMTSTAILEAMLMGRPVAALDYFNVPRFVPTAWTISAPEHFLAVVPEMLNPPPAKMLFQQDCWRYCLRSDGPAAPRVAELIRKMVEISRSLREVAGTSTFPVNLLAFHDWLPAGAPVPLAQLYEGQQVFAADDVQSLRVRFARLQREHAALKEELQTRSLGYWLAAAGRFLAKKVNK